MRSRDPRRTARRACLVLAGALGLGLLTQAAASAQEGDEGRGGGQDKVVICHATSSETNPYNRIEVAAPAAANGHAHGLEDDEGAEHGGHTDDIVPPFTYRQGGEDRAFPGQNWDEQGQAIWDAGCEVPEPAEPEPTLDVAVSAEDVCLGDEVTVVLDNTGSDVDATFAGTLTAPDGGTTPLEETVAAGRSGELTLTPELTGTFAYAYTASAEGVDPVTGEVGFAVEDCEEVAFVATVVTDADADGICVGEDVTITLDNTGSDVAAEFSLVGATGEGDETTITRTVAAGETETITRTPELGTYQLDWTATVDGSDDLAGQVAYDVIDCTTEVEPDIQCPDGTTEVDGACVVDEVVCPDGTTEVDGACVIETVVADEVLDRDGGSTPAPQPTEQQVVAEVDGDTEVRGVQRTAGVAAAGELPVTGAATVPLLVVFGLLNLLFGVRLRRYGLQVRQPR